jgi:maltose alpha-D-glucosyltransferase/alpha-amylase
MAQTPAIPDGAQWGIFLRNHDELTLEMVTDEERDYMYAEYAKDPRMKRNVGIARRLLPLLDNDRRVAELFHGLLFSLPGSPIMYYGDEIGMGDNIYLGDRDGVRTPMQWTPDRNGGFSTADFAALYLPSLMDPVFGYQAVNVESQLRDPSSMLHWIQQLIAARKQHSVFGTGSFEALDVANPAAFAYLRHQVRDDGSDDIVLCVNNLSKLAQPVEIDLSHLDGKIPVELFGRVAFPRIGELPYFVTLPPYGFYWFSLVDELGDDLR